MAAMCKANYPWTQDAYVTAMQRHYQLKLRTEFRILLKVTCALLLAFVLFVTLLSFVFPGPDPAPYWSLLLTAAICIYGLVFDRVNVWNWKRKFLKRHYADAPVEWVFMDNVVKTKTELGESTSKWQAFIKVVEFNDGFLFYTMHTFFYWIPFHSFDSINCIETVREMIVRNQCTYILQK